MYIYPRKPYDFNLASKYYRQISNKSHTLVGNKIADHSDEVGTCRRCSNYIFILNLPSGFNVSNYTPLNYRTHCYGAPWWRVYISTWILYRAVAGCNLSLSHFWSCINYTPPVYRSIFIRSISNNLVCKFYSVGIFLCKCILIVNIDI